MCDSGFYALNDKCESCGANTFSVDLRDEKEDCCKFVLLATKLKLNETFKIYKFLCPKRNLFCQLSKIFSKLLG